MSRSATRSFFDVVSLSLICALAVSCGATPALQAQALPAQESPSTAASTSNSPAAYVYVMSISSNNKVDIYAYSAASTGRLMRVAGSPFSTDLSYGASIAGNRKYLFATDGIDINSYSIASDGALQQVDSVDAQQFNQSNCGGPTALFLDHTGATLYDLDIYGDCANNGYQFFNAHDSTGELNYLGVTAVMSPIFGMPLSFLGNNVYGYGASCYHWYQEIFGFMRNGDGALTDLNINASMPAAKAGQFYCPGLAAADAANHVAVPMQAVSGSTFQAVGTGQLATYTADNSGNLTSTSAYSNMPGVAVATITGISMSPSGKLLAVSGTGGLQVFHFNGAGPITHYTGLLTRSPIDQLDQIAWDNDNHLYAISQSAGKLFVFTITPTNYMQAEGSPYRIASPVHITALPR